MLPELDLNSLAPRDSATQTRVSSQQQQQAVMLQLT